MPCRATQSSNFSDRPTNLKPEGHAPKATLGRLGAVHEHLCSGSFARDGSQSSVT